MLSNARNPCPSPWATQLQQQLDALTHATQAGTHFVKQTKKGWNNYPITFTRPFLTPPIVTLAIAGQGNGYQTMIYIGLKDLTPTGFTARIHDTATSGNLTIHWIAVGQ